MDKNNLGKTENIVLGEIEKLLDKKVGTVELNRAKEQLKSSVIMDLESMSSRMQYLAKSEFHLGASETLPDIITGIDRITREDIMLLVQKYMQKENWSKVTILPK
jgi:predicted Zn-dependent peptidase